LKETGSAKKGSVAPKSPTAFVHSKAIAKTVRNRENTIRGSNIETGFCIGKDGKVIFSASDGSDHKIDLNGYEEQLKDSVFTHNHPSGTTLSTEDIATAVKCGIAQLRACHANGCYMITRQYGLDDKLPDDVSEKYLNFAWDYYEAQENAIKKVDKIWEKSDKTQEDADHCNNLVAEFRKTWLKRNAEAYGWKYEEERL